MEEADYSKIDFLKSVYEIGQLPETLYPEIAFAGRSNVGKSSLMNRLVNRKNLVKVSARPGKTQCLNFFKVADQLFLVDLPGYGFAKVSRQVQMHWKKLIRTYLESRPNLCVVVVIVDLRHSAKQLDIDFINWLREMGISFQLVYTKLDKLSGNNRQKMARSLDKAFHVAPSERILFSAKTGAGKQELIDRLDSFVG
jgi:GTP-binding protein